MDLMEEALRLYKESMPEIQAEFTRLKANREKARELADMVGSVAVDKQLPLEVLELVAVCIAEDCKQIRQAAKDIEEEQWAIKHLAEGRGKEREAWQAGQKSIP